VAAAALVPKKKTVVLAAAYIGVLDLEPVFVLSVLDSVPFV
jgi:hypothetical protein